MHFMASKEGRFARSRSLSILSHSFLASFAMSILLPEVARAITFSACVSDFSRKVYFFARVVFRFAFAFAFALVVVLTFALGLICGLVFFGAVNFVFSVLFLGVDFCVVLALAVFFFALLFWVNFLIAGLR